MTNRIHIYYGDGKGKTSRAIGLGIRNSGAGGRVLFVQLFKDGSSSEIGVLEKTDGIDCLYSTEKFGFTWQMTNEEKERARDTYISLFDKACRNATSYNVIIFDELLSLISTGFAEEEYILKELLEVKKNCEVVITGHIRSERMLKAGDYVSHIEKIKHPYDCGEAARKGIEF